MSLAGVTGYVHGFFGFGVVAPSRQADVVDGMRFDVKFAACLSRYCHIVIIIMIMTDGWGFTAVADQLDCN